MCKALELQYAECSVYCHVTCCVHTNYIEICFLALKYIQMGKLHTEVKYGVRKQNSAVA